MVMLLKTSPVEHIVCACVAEDCDAHGVGICCVSSCCCGGGIWSLQTECCFNVECRLWVQLGWLQQLPWPLPHPLPVSGPSRNNQQGPVAALEPALYGHTELDSASAGPTLRGRMWSPAESPAHLFLPACFLLLFVLFQLNFPQKLAVQRSGEVVVWWMEHGCEGGELDFAHIKVNGVFLRVPNARHVLRKHGKVRDNDVPAQKSLLQGRWNLEKLGLVHL